MGAFIFSSSSCTSTMWKIVVLLAMQLCFGASARFRGSTTTVGEEISSIQTNEYVAAKGSSLVSEGLTQSENIRALQQQSATVKIINDCGFRVKAGLNYTASNGSVLKWSYIRKGGQWRVGGVTKPTIYLFGSKNSGETVLSGSSDLCLSATDCFRQVNLGSLASGSVNYKPCSQTIQASQGAPWTPVQVAPVPVASPTPAPVAYASGASDWTTAWLTAHNSRRANFYNQHGLGRKDLKWSPGVAQSAQLYAESLLSLNGCSIQHGYQGNSYGGENLACNWGDDVSRTPEEVMQAWFDDEQNLPFGQNLHYYQVAWRGTSYVGCGQASKPLGGGSTCFIQACRYVAPGNCNVDENNILGLALQDSSPCTPSCPPEQCF